MLDNGALDATGFVNFGHAFRDYYKCPELMTQDGFEHGGTLDRGQDLDPTAAVDTLRFERYLATPGSRGSAEVTRSFTRTAYYAMRPLMPVAVRKHLQRWKLRGWAATAFPAWPVACHVEDLLESTLQRAAQGCEMAPIPFIWFWPDGREACLIVSHDVETARGRDFCSRLMDVDDEFDVKASFQIVPEKRYAVSKALLHDIQQRGFEVNVHGLYHDGRLFDSRATFLERAKLIDKYRLEYGAAGFRSPIMYRNVDWYDALEFEYDMSVPNVAHLDPQHGGCCTVMPYFIGRILELPLTMTQDYALFHLLRVRTLDLWKEQASIILGRHGLLHLLVHPDYVIPAKYMTVYRALLSFLQGLRRSHEIWHALPVDVNRWWRQRAAMRLTRSAHGWQVEGPGSDRALVAFLTVADGRVVYQLS